MFNVIRMDIHHMFRAKCFWVMTLITIAFLFLMGYTAYETNERRKAYTEEELEEMQLTMDEEEFEDYMRSMDVSLENLVLSEAVAEHSGQALLLLVSLFAVLFALRERRNGFIKNIAGGIKHRWYLWVSKVVVMMIYILLIFLLTILCLGISEQVFGIHGDMSLGKSFWQAMGIQYLLYLVFCMFCITIVNIARIPSVSLIVSIFASMGFPMMIALGLEQLLGVEKFFVHEYMAEYQIMQVTGMPKGAALRTVWLVIVGGIVFYSVLSSLLLEKRDVC